jgi:hypothetical protein
MSSSTSPNPSKSTNPILSSKLVVGPSNIPLWTSSSFNYYTMWHKESLDFLHYELWVVTHFDSPTLCLSHDINTCNVEWICFKILYSHLCIFYTLLHETLWIFSKFHLCTF